ncbi:efflux transporter, outer membrane factor (OMF) lipoprotein, NodT family [Dyadobacter sp. SG02]|uniref:efflux transporter outer membrane subunit n=1 Tax=Dyadobacter sp. SG02 TaxID=1855291 RepID=UPI0008B366C6|nr:efflux transporter outer membrane subunit [Dyadobacter sp. SG02]SEI51883.1 efflux transporter, outer membrane factor (OMF) lipoprotein, NodT family [Dyadobacter sp. SG02]
MANYKNVCLVLLIAAALGACRVSKDMQTPADAVPQSFRDVSTTDTVSIAELPWKDFFSDPLLQRLIDTAIVKNYDMQIALTNIEAAGLLVKQAKWNNVPTVNLGIGASTTNPSDNSLSGLTAGQFLGTNHLKDFSIGLNLSWEADVWGKIRSQNKLAASQYLQSIEARKAVQTHLVANVANGYYNLLMLDEQLAVAGKNESLNDSTLRMIRLQFENGQVSSLAVQQAQAQLNAVQQLIPGLEQLVAVQENALRVLAGEFPDKITRTTSLAAIEIPQGIAVGLPLTLVSRRPDVRKEELGLVAANASVGLSKAQLYPALRISAGGGLNSLKASDWFNMPASLFGIVAGSVTQPLLQRRELRTRYEIALAEREKSVLQFRKAVLTAVGEVSDAMVQIEKLRASQAFADNRAATLRQAVSNAGLLFNNGAASYLEVITAQGNVLQSELDVALLKRQQLAALSDLYRSLGGGWK